MIKLNQLLGPLLPQGKNGNYLSAPDWTALFSCTVKTLCGKQILCLETRQQISFLSYLLALFISIKFQSNLHLSLASIPRIVLEQSIPDK